MRVNLAVAVLVTATATRAFAQGSITYTPELDPDRFVLTSDPNSVALTDGARPLDYLQFSLGMALRFGAPPLQVCVEDGTGRCATEGDLVSNRFGSDLVAAVGFGRVGFYAQLPVVLYQTSDFDNQGTELAVSGFGDLRLGGKLLVAQSGGSALALDVRGLLPTGGGGDDFTGDGGTSIETRAIYEYRSGRGAMALQAGYSWRQQPSRLANLFIDDELLWSVGGEYMLTPKKVSAGLAVFGRIGLMSDSMALAGMRSPDWEERPTETMASLRFWMTPATVLELGAGAALTSGYGPAFRALLGIRFSPPIDQDPDRDRIMTVVDKCPLVAEDFDKFEDEDGCPDLDNDKDTILDVADLCPNDPEDFDKFEDPNGCPEPDNDKDGILDAADACPNDPEDFDKFEDVDGCPDPDNDKDGILDVVDKCPMDPEDKDGFEDSDGCPDPDNDNDKILDVDDKCPNDPETYNGIEDADGCPDTKPTVVVTSTAIEIKETIYFDLDKAIIKKRSFSLLDDVAAALTTFPKLHISIEGHTDDRADDKYNLKLSQKRAEAVRAYLINAGIAADRLTAIGYGESRPKVKAKTENARNQNRRVEFLIVTPASQSGTTVVPTPPAPTPAPVTPAPVTPAPVTPAPVTPAPVP